MSAPINEELRRAAEELRDLLARPESVVIATEGALWVNPVGEPCPARLRDWPRRVTDIG